MHVYFEEFVSYAEMYWSANRSQRKGQAYFNALHRLRPDIANDLTASSVDPFYNDDRIPSFLESVKDCW